MTELAPKAPRRRAERAARRRKLATPERFYQELALVHVLPALDAGPMKAAAILELAPKGERNNLRQALAWAELQGLIRWDVTAALWELAPKTRG